MKNLIFEINTHNLVSQEGVQQQQQQQPGATNLTEDQKKKLDERATLATSFYVKLLRLNIVELNREVFDVHLLNKLLLNFVGADLHSELLRESLHFLAAFVQF